MRRILTSDLTEYRSILGKPFNQFTFFFVVNVNRTVTYFHITHPIIITDPDIIFQLTPD